MDKNRQTKLNNKKRKHNEAKKQEVIQHKQQALTRQRELEAKRARMSHEVYLDSIVPRNHEGRRQVYRDDLAISWGMLLGSAGLFGSETLRVDESRHIKDLTNVIDHNPNEFKT